MTDSQRFSDREKTSSKELCRIDAIKKKITLIEDGNPAKYRLQTTADNPDQIGSYRKITFGERDPKKTHKTILMVGETGTGKTSLINTMINYTCGVQKKDKIWIEITDDQSDRTSAHSQTSDVTIYGVYIPETLVDLTIIDTPGYGDTRGISHDKEITESLLRLCTSADVVHEIDAVCFVIKADQNRLTGSQQYIFDAVLSLFGKDIEENIVLLLTHSNGRPPKNALTAVKEAKVKCAVDEKNQPIYFLFDNCLSETLDEDYETIQQQSWDLSYKGMARFFMCLDRIHPKTLIMTRDVLTKRKQLEANISNLKSRVQMMEQKENVVKQTQEALENHRNDVLENMDFEFTVEVPYKVAVNINPDKASVATRCTFCEENCHYPGCWWVTSLSWCEVFEGKHCTVCTNKCHISEHVKDAKIYETKTRTETRTFEGLKKKHKGLKKKLEDKIETGESVINELKKELQEYEKEKKNLLNEAFHCLESLEMIALKTDSQFILQHIDFLIEKMKEIKELEKATALEYIKKRAGGKKK